MANRWGNSGNSGWLYFSGLQNHCRWWLQPWNKKTFTPWKESYDQPRQHIKKQRHYFVHKGPSSQGYGFSSGQVWMWELDYKESWAPKNWCFWTVVLEKILESSLDCKEIQPVQTKGYQSLVFICTTDSFIVGFWSWNSNTLATWCEELTHLKRPWCWEGLKEGGEGNGRGWNGWMASLTQWTWVWVDSRSWWWTGRPGVLRFMGSQRVRHDWATGLTELLVHKLATLSIVQPLLIASYEFWFVNENHMLIMTVMSSNSIFILFYGCSLYVFKSPNSKT